MSADLLGCEAGQARRSQLRVCHPQHCWHLGPDVVGAVLCLGSSSHGLSLLNTSSSHSPARLRSPKTSPDCRVSPGVADCPSGSVPALGLGSGYLVYSELPGCLPSYWALKVHTCTGRRTLSSRCYWFRLSLTHSVSYYPLPGIPVGGRDRTVLSALQGSLSLHDFN